MTEADLRILRELAEKLERPVQVYLDYRNVERAEALRRVLAALAMGHA